jgi:hypothetical protein
MIDDWFSAIGLPITWQQFWQLPQNPAYKYEYFDGRAWLSPRPKSYHAVLDLQTYARPDGGIATRNEVAIRPLEEADWSELPSLFAAAFHRVQPFQIHAIERDRGNPALVRDWPQLFYPLGGETRADGARASR